MGSFGCSAILVAEPNAAVSSPGIFTSGTTPPPDFESLRIKGLNISLHGPQDTIDPDYAGIRSSLASLGIGYIGYSNNNFYNNLLPAEQSTLGQQTYNGQKPTFLTNNVMQLTFDLSRYGIPDGQIVAGGIFVYDTWKPAGPNAVSLATLSYYQTFLNKQVELKFGYLNNFLEFWGPFLAGSLSASIFGPSSTIPVETGFNHYAWTTPGINIKINGPEGFYNKVGIQRASSPDGPFAEKTANPTALKWSTPNSGVLVINEVGYRQEAAPGDAIFPGTPIVFCGLDKGQLGDRTLPPHVRGVLLKREFVPTPSSHSACILAPNKSSLWRARRSSIRAFSMWQDNSLVSMRPG